jgi:hypothetical protein
MPIDLTNEHGLRDQFQCIQVHENDGRGSEITYRTLSQVARRFPPSRGGRPVHVATVTRWIIQGARLRDGTRLRLRAVRLPGRWVVEPEAVDEFLATLTADRSGLPTEPAAAGSSVSSRTASTRRRVQEQAARELDKIGIR